MTEKNKSSSEEELEIETYRGTRVKIKSSKNNLNHLSKRAKELISYMEEGIPANKEDRDYIR